MTAMDPKLRAELAEMLLAAGGRRPTAERLALSRLAVDDAMLRRLATPYLQGIVAHAFAQLSRGVEGDAPSPMTAAADEEAPMVLRPAARPARKPAQGRAVERERLVIERAPPPAAEVAMTATHIGIPAEEAEELPRPPASPRHLAALMLLAKAQAAKRR